MTYYGAKDLERSFRTVRGNTIKIAEEIPEEKYGFRATPDTRSVGELLVHIALNYRVQHHIHGTEGRTALDGFDFPGFMQGLSAEARSPRSKAQILDLLRTEGEVWATYLSGLSDRVLAEMVAMRPETHPAAKSRFEMIAAVKEHEMHHRGQLMLIERMLGIVPHLTREMDARMAHRPQAPART